MTHDRLPDYRRAVISTSELQDWVRKLLQLMDETDPRRTAAKGKDGKSRLALMVLGQLVLRLGSWVIYHQIGLRLNNVPFVPMTPASLPQGEKDEFRRAQERADAHENELDAAAAGRLENRVARAAAADVLWFLLGRIHPFDRLSLALRGLDLGEVDPMLELARKGRHGRAYTLARLRLRALEHVAFRRGVGLTDEAARAEVAPAFVADRETLITWRQRLPDDLGRFVVRHKLAVARHHGRLHTRLGLRAEPAEEDASLADFLRSTYLDQALSEDGAAYRAALDQAGSSGERPLGA